MAMEFYILNKSLQVVGVIDTYKSAIWTRRYYTSGDFEIYVPATDENTELLQEGFFVVRVDDTTKCMIIDSVGIKTDSENGDYLTATGKSLSSVLSRRIMWKQTQYTGLLEMALRRMVYDNAISPDMAARTIPQLELGEVAGLTEHIQIQLTGDNIETAISDTCKSYGIGYDVLFDFDRRKFIFIIYKGTDRSFNQSENPFVIFSPDYENIISSDYVNSSAAFKNTAQVAGEGQGVDRIKTAVNNANAGLERYELFVDARDISSNSGEVSASDYITLLQRRGTEKLAELETTESVNSEVASSETFKLNTDYFLGDIVEIINEYGIGMTPRVTEVIEANDDSGYSCIPTFANE